VEVEENILTRTKRNVFGDIFHQLSYVATDGELHQQLHMDEEQRNKAADTPAQQM
jgi:hypothetical protein